MHLVGFYYKKRNYKFLQKQSENCYNALGDYCLLQCDAVWIQVFWDATLCRSVNTECIVNRFSERRQVLARLQQASRQSNVILSVLLCALNSVVLQFIGLSARVINVFY